MPLKRKYRPRRRYVRRKRTTNYRRRRGYMMYKRVTPGVQKYKDCKLYYCDVNTSGVDVHSNVAWIYQSSLYDPYYPVGGHQPLFFDQYAAMYRYYVVFGVAYNIECSTDSATNGPLFITAYPTTTSSVFGTLSSIRERKSSKESLVSHGYKGRLKGYASVKNVLGVSRTKLLADDQYSALCNANPAQVMFLHFQAWNQSATSSISVYMSTRLTFYCRFFDPVEPAQS